MKNSNDTIWNQTYKLPVCSAVPQPTAPSCNPKTLDTFQLKYHSAALNSMTLKISPLKTSEFKTLK
jgi:hypothetical protein